MITIQDPRGPASGLPLDAGLRLQAIFPSVLFGAIVAASLLAAPKATQYEQSLAINVVVPIIGFAGVLAAVRRG